MPIDNRSLEPGTVLVGRYKGKDLSCEVVQTDDGVRYRFDGTDYNSPSSAGKAAMDGIACNGWRFWSVAGTEPAKRERKAKAETKAPPKKRAAEKATKKKGGKKAKAARAASEGSYACGACGETFATMKAATAHAMTHTTS
jgi:hypothetical protein